MGADAGAWLSCELKSRHIEIEMSSRALGFRLDVALPKLRLSMEEA